MRKSTIAFFIVYLLGTTIGYSQTISDSTHYSNDTLFATITAFGQFRNERNTLPSIKAIQGAALDRYNKTSLVPSFNSIAGVRMEERSPGSYRINIRGSSLRSPFGVRNVKVYYNDIPLTDPGGNTYFNQLAFNNIASIEVAKGPASSLYGAGTGGAILLNTLTPWQNGVEAEIVTGSYGLLNLLGTAKWQTNNRKQNLAISHSQHDGYRDQSRMRRNNASYSGEIIKKDKYQMNIHGLFTDLYYQTPGGLTLNEYNANPKQARPAAGNQPSAKGNNASIQQQNLLVGIEQQIKFSDQFTNKTTLYGAYASIENPSIRNYEMRSEPHTGGRTVFRYSAKTAHTTFTWLNGAELQYGKFNTDVYANLQGKRGTLQTEDDLRFTTWNAFSQINLLMDNGLDITAGISTFDNAVSITRQNVQPVVKQQKQFKNEWAPRLSIVYQPAKTWQFSALIARGYSPPTVAELLPSTSVISLDLNAESGWNYESGIRYNSSNNRWHSDLNFFRFGLNNALVQRRDNSGADFYTNAGSTVQQGIEWNGQYLKTFQQQKIQVINIKGAYTFSHFTYKNFSQLQNDFSGNRLPSVPVHTFSLMTDLQWQNSFFAQGTFYGASSIWLNDANSAQADAYQLVGLRVGYGKKWQVYAGVDNLLNQTYSLGNDINAFGGRFFNAAPPRNWYAGLKIKFI